MSEQEQAALEERVRRVDLVLEDWGIGVLGFTLEELEQVLAPPQSRRDRSR